MLKTSQINKQFTDTCTTKQKQLTHSISSHYCKWALRQNIPWVQASASAVCWSQAETFLLTPVEAGEGCSRSGQREAMLWYWGSWEEGSKTGWQRGVGRGGKKEEMGEEERRDNKCLEKREIRNNKSTISLREYFKNKIIFFPPVNVSVRLKLFRIQSF